MSLSVDIKKKFPNFTLDMHFSLSGRRVGILGASGCGKSMTLRSIAGIFQPDEGRIVLGDRVLYDSARRVDLKPQVRNIGYLFQNYALFPNMTVRENIMAGLSGSKNAKMARANEMIAKFGLSSLEDRLPRQLSGGQQQRCALARIMAYRPDVILLDEPFSALDWYLRDRMQRELSDMLKDYEGMVIMVSHDRDEIFRFSEELLIVDAGHVIRQGATREVFSNPGTRSAAVLTGCKNFSRAERIDDHHVRATDWGITVETERVLPEGIRDLGFRAHQFKPVYMRDEEAFASRLHGEARNTVSQEILASRTPQKLKNAVRCNVVSQAELQFERNYYIDPESSDGDGSLITWLVQRELWPMLDAKGLPDYLVMPEEDFLFLT
jgi:molybdate transport system ATP-binding protein